MAVGTFLERDERDVPLRAGVGRVALATGAYLSVALDLADSGDGRGG